MVDRQPLWKMMEFVSWDDDISNIWKDKKFFKPPTSQGVQIFESPTIPTVHSHAGGVCFFVDWLPYWAQSLSSTQKVLRNRRANPKKSEVGLAKEAWAILQITQWQHHFPFTQRPKMPKIRECQMESCYTSREHHMLHHPHFRFSSMKDFIKSVSFATPSKGNPLYNEARQPPTERCPAKV